MLLIYLVIGVNVNQLPPNDKLRYDCRNSLIPIVNNTLATLSKHRPHRILLNTRNHSQPHSMEFKKIQTIIFFAVLIGITALFFQMLKPYLFPLFWAAVIAAIFHPFYNWINRRVKQPNISAGITLVTVLLVVLLPLAGIFSIVVKQGFDTYEQLSQPETIENLQDTARAAINKPLVQRVMGDLNIEQRIKQASSGITSTGFQWLKIGSQNTAIAIVQTLVMLYSLYYFIKDGDQWLKRLMHLLPLGDKNEQRLYQQFVSTGKATLKGTILIGGIQGTIGGILFAIVGIPSAAFWGLIMIVLSIIPAVGPVLVWVPAAIYLFATGQIWQAIVLVIGGAGIGLIDNLLRAPLVGKDIQMHPMVIFFSTIGGLGLFGISGVVVGPIIATFFLSIVQMYETRYKRELDSAST